MARNRLIAGLLAGAAAAALWGASVQAESGRRENGHPGDRFDFALVPRVLPADGFQAGGRRLPPGLAPGQERGPTRVLTGLRDGAQLALAPLSETPRSPSPRVEAAPAESRFAPALDLQFGTQLAQLPAPAVPPARPAAAPAIRNAVASPAPGPTPVAAPLPPPPTGKTVAVRAEAGPDEARLVLRWPGPVVTRSSVSGRELVLRFDAELQAPEMERVAETLSGWVEGLQQGYDSLLVLAAREVAFEVASAGETVEIVLRPVSGAAGSGAGPVAASEGSPEERRRLALIGARLKAQLGEARAARETIRRVIGEGGRTFDAVAQLAEVERQLGNWQRALELYDEALVLAPDDRGLIAAKASLLRERGADYLGTAERQIVTGGDSQWIGRSEARLPVLERGEILTSSEQRDVTVDSLIRPNGDQDRFEGQRARAEIAYVQNFDEEAMSIRPAFFASTQTAGGGFAVERRDGFGTTSLGTEYHKSYWDLIEGIASGGTRDRVELSRQQRLDPEGRWAMRTAVNHNRYGLDNVSDVAQSIGAQGELSYTFSEARPFASINYQLDGEYVLGRESRTAANGLEFAPLPLVSREVHTALLYTGDQLADNLAWTAFAGYSYDRINFDSIVVTPSKLTFTGLQWGGELVYEPAVDFQLGVRYASSDTSNRGTSNSLTQLSFFATGRF